MSKRGIVKKISVQRGTPRESDTASRREEACLLIPCNVVPQLVTSQPVTADLTLTCFSHTDVLGPSRKSRKTARIIHSAQRTCTHFVKFPTLAKTQKSNRRHGFRAQKRKHEQRYTETDMKEFDSVAIVAIMDLELFLSEKA